MHPNDSQQGLYGLVEHLTSSTSAKFVFAAGHRVFQKCQKLSPSNPVSTRSELERNGGHRVNLCAEEILALI